MHIKIPTAIATPKPTSTPLTGHLLVLVACWSGEVNLIWSEGALLPTGQTIVVKRSATGKMLGEIGGSGGEPDLVTVTDKTERDRGADDTYRKIVNNWHGNC